MRRLFKYIVSRTYKPLLVKYLSGTTCYRYKDIKMEIPPEVFHPGFFTSTKFLLKYLSTLSVAQKDFLELGAGSGLIAICSARKGANVTASDINPVAVQTLRKNKTINKVEMRVVASDLFAQIPRQSFDVIVINPPYYKKDPVSEKDYAWYCGKNGEYFLRLFNQLDGYIHKDTQTIMVLCDECDLAMINHYANCSGFMLLCMATSKSLIEKNFIYKIEKGGG